MTVDCTGCRVTRTRHTEAAYQRRFLALRARAVRETGQRLDDDTLLDWFVSQNGRWRPSTIRQYRAALRFAIETTARLGALMPARADHLIRRVAAGPIPLSKQEGPKRTSRRKRKTVSLGEFALLLRELRAGSGDDRLAAWFLGVNVHLALRPCEYERACLRGTVLAVPNAKATNGRALGDTRVLDISGIAERRPSFPAALRCLLLALKVRAQAVGGYKTLLSRLAARIARACERIGIGRVALYTTRHVALATAKQVMSPEEVATLAGHKTTATAATHYARRRSGLSHKFPTARPDPAAVRNVISSPKVSRMTNVEHRRVQVTVAPASLPRPGGPSRTP